MSYSSAYHPKRSQQTSGRGYSDSNNNSQPLQSSWLNVQQYQNPYDWRQPQWHYQQHQSYQQDYSNGYGGYNQNYDYDQHQWSSASAFTPIQSSFIPVKGSSSYQQSKHFKEQSQFQPKTKKPQVKEAENKPKAKKTQSKISHEQRENVNREALFSNAGITSLADEIFKESKKSKKKNNQSAVPSSSLINEETNHEEESKVSLEPVREELETQELETIPDEAKKPINDWDIPFDFNSAKKPIVKKKDAVQVPHPQDKCITLKNEESKAKDQTKISKPTSESTLKIKQEAQEPSKSDLSKKTKPSVPVVPQMDKEEVKALIEQSDEYKMWKNIPKAQRERLTTKQMMRVMRPDMMSEGLALQVVQTKQPQKKIVQTSEIAEETNPQPQKTKKTEVPVKPKQFKEQNPDSVVPSQPQKPQFVKVPQSNPDQSNDFKLKAKPKKIVVEERNEFNEIVRHFVDKSRKSKISALKKAILKKRERAAQLLKLRNEREQDTNQVKLMKRNSQQSVQDDLSSGYVTIDDQGNEIQKANDPVKEHQKSSHCPLIQTKGLPYQAIFSDLEGICSSIQDEMNQRFDALIARKKGLKEEISKEYVRFREIKDPLFQDSDSIVDQSSKFLLHPDKKTREYVDMVQSAELDNLLFALIQKLKKIYFNRKTNPNKKGKVTKNLKKRYIVGINEVIKHLHAQNLKMIVMAINLERVEGDKGLDDMVYDVIQACSAQRLPLVFCLTRYRLGFVSKFQGQQASILGIFNFQGANEEFSAVVAKSRELRESFYKQLSQNLDEYQIKLLRKENRYLDWQLFDRLKVAGSSGMSAMENLGLDK